MGKWFVFVVLLGIIVWMIHKKRTGDMQFNFVLCLLAANISALVGNMSFLVRVVVFLLIFVSGYLIARKFNEK